MHRALNRAIKGEQQLNQEDMALLRIVYELSRKKTLVFHSGILSNAPTAIWIVKCY